jgi:hypothetical protein
MREAPARQLMREKRLTDKGSVKTEGAGDAGPLRSAHPSLTDIF